MIKYLFVIVLLYTSSLHAQQWTLVRSMQNPRYNFSSCLLDNGKVLVAGGTDPLGVVIKSTEVYDPLEDTWTSVWDLQVPRCGAPIVRLLDGRCYIPSGSHGRDSMTLTSEVFHPASQKWELVTGVRQPRYGESAITLPNGKVLIVGGFDLTTQTSHATCELYDPILNTDTMTGEISQWQMGSMLFLDTPRNKVIMISDKMTIGSVGTWFNTTEEYDIATGKWSIVAHSEAPHGTWSQQSIQLWNGEILAPSGGSHLGMTTPLIEIYNPGTKTWRTIGELPFPRYLGTTVQISDDSVLIAGGYDPQRRNVLSDCRIINVKTGEVTPAPSLWDYRYFHRMHARQFTDPNDPGVTVVQVFVFGGAHGGHILNTSERLELRSSASVTRSTPSIQSLRVINQRETLVCIDMLQTDRTIEVVNMLGQVVFSKSISASDDRVEISSRGFPAGIYIVRAIGKHITLSARVLISR